MKNMKLIIKFFLLVFLLSACSNNINDFQKPATFWYEQIILAVNDNNLEKADNYFSSLQSEHIASPLIKDALVLLIQAHIDNNEHLLSSFFVSEYKKRYSDKNNIDFISFLETKANYYAFSNYSKDHGYITNTISKISTFVQNNNKNPYLPYITHILTSFKLAKREINKEAIRIYKMQDKPKAQEKYEMYNEELGLDSIESRPSYIPWYVLIFNW